MEKQGSIKEIAVAIQKRAEGKNHFVVALAGFGGAGKSTAARKLADVLGNAAVISLDEFIINRLEDRSADWDGFDWTRLIEQVLQPIQHGDETITYHVYDWPQNKIIQEKTLALPKYIIIEGCGLIRESLDEYFDFSIWIDLPLEVASERGSTRDREEYKVDHDRLWKERWTPNDKDYFEKYQPAAHADFLLEGSNICIMQKENMYLSYLMGAGDITDNELTDLGIEIVGKTESGSRKLKIPKEVIARYADLVKEKMTPGFWNEFLGETEICFIFKFENGKIKEYTLSPENEQEIDELCGKVNHEPPHEAANVYKYISENEFYHDFMREHYRDMIEP